MDPNKIDQKATRKNWINFGIGFLAVAALLVVGLSWGSDSGEVQGHPSAVAGLAAVPAAPAKAAPTKDFFTDMYGQFKVGDGVGQIPPGTYQITVTPGQGGGYWERCSNFECKISFGSDDSVIANDYLKSGSGYLVVKPTDYAVTIEDLTLVAVK